MIVESQNNPLAVRHTARGELHEVGILQITRRCVEDTNRIIGRRVYRWPEDCYSKERSVEIAIVYLGHYGRAMQRETGREPTYQDLARIWNGGPHGHQRRSTLPYWQRVERVLAR